MGAVKPRQPNFVFCAPKILAREEIWFILAFTIYPKISSWKEVKFSLSAKFPDFI